MCAHQRLGTRPGQVLWPRPAPPRSTSGSTKVASSAAITMSALPASPTPRQAECRAPRRSPAPRSRTPRRTPPRSPGWRRAAPRATSLGPPCVRCISLMSTPDAEAAARRGQDHHRCARIRALRRDAAAQVEPALHRQRVDRRGTAMTTSADPVAPSAPQRFIRSPPAPPLYATTAAVTPAPPLSRHHAGHVNHRCRATTPAGFVCSFGCYHPRNRQTKRLTCAFLDLAFAWARA